MDTISGAIYSICLSNFLGICLFFIQRAVHKLAADVLNGIENKKDVIVAWGDGSFKPTSSGHASAPNKKLMLSLARFMTIVLVDEHGTTKNSCCCMEKALERKTHGLRAR